MFDNSREKRMEVRRIQTNYFDEGQEKKENYQQFVRISEDKRRVRSARQCLVLSSRLLQQIGLMKARKGQKYCWL